MIRALGVGLMAVLAALLGGVGTTSALFGADGRNAGNAFATGLFPPVLVLVPHATGSPVRGETLTATTGTWTRADRYAHQWLRCDASVSSCTEIAGATGSSYVLGAADVGANVAVRSTAMNGANGPTTSAVSLPTAETVDAEGPTLTTAPAITAPSSGTTYTATTGVWGAGGIDLLGLAGVYRNGTPTRQWYRCDAVGASCVPIPGQTGASYARTSADVGGRLRVRVEQPWAVVGLAGVSLLSGQVAAFTQATPVVP